MKGSNHHAQSQQYLSEEPVDKNLMCAKCHNTPDDLLILTCDHNLCLPCASKNLHREHKKAQHSFQTVVCEMCEIATVLDPASATELLSMYPNEELDPKNARKSKQQPPYMNDHHHLNNPQMDVPVGNPVRGSHNFYTHNPSSSYNNEAHDSMRRNLRPEREPCREHPDEEVNYFCFDCICPPICSECVVHGAHRGHNVATVRKAYPQVMAKVEELGLQLNSKIDELHLQSQRLESRKREVIDQTNAIKQQMANAFEELRQRLDKKEREMMINADQFMERNLQEVDSYVRLLNGRCINLNSTVDLIKHASKSNDDVGLMNYYALNHQKIQQSALETDLQQLKEIPKQVNLKCDIDTTSLNRFVEDLEGLQLSIAALDGEIIDDGTTVGNAPQPNKSKPQQFKKPNQAAYQTDKYQQQQNQSMRQQQQTQQQPVQSVFDLAYRQKNPFQQSTVAQTMNKLAEQKYGHGFAGVNNNNLYSQQKYNQQTPPQQDNYY